MKNIRFMQGNYIEKVVKERTKLGVDVVIDAVGTLFKQALALVRRKGRIILFGQNYNAQSKIAQNSITRDEITVMGSFIAQHTFPLTVEIIESGKMELSKLVTHHFSLKEVSRGMEAMKKEEAIKVIIIP